MAKLKPVLIASGLIILTLFIVAPGLARGRYSFQPPAPDFVSGEIIVKFKPQVGMVNAQDTLQLQGWHLLRVSPRSKLMRVRVPPGREAEAIAALNSRANVEFATYNYKIYALDTPNDPDFDEQWALHNTGQTGGSADADIDAPEAWDIHTGGDSVTIAVLDTGVYAAHEDLQANIWVNEGEIPANGIDDDGNGYVDDYRGYDFYNKDSNPDDDHGHGTHVAGIAAASGNNGRGIAGVSWRAKIMALKVLSASGGGSSYDMAEAIDYAVSQGARVINMSLGVPDSEWPCDWPHVEEALNYALSHGVLIIAAAGNDPQKGVNCPGAYDQVMAVGATTASDIRASYSNYGPRLDIAAPGGDLAGGMIYSTVLSGDYGYKFGTSMATPHVAGLGALIWSYNPGLFQPDVRSIIQATADDLGSTGWDQFYGHGRINAHRALESLVDFQTSPAHLGFLVDDHGGPYPTSNEIQIISNDAAGITWTARITPPVTWLTAAEPTSGTVSVASSPDGVALTAERPSTYGRYNTTVVISGAKFNGQGLGTRTTQVNLSYVPEVRELYLPLIFKNATFEPDLIVENLIAAGNAVTVTISNQGNAAVTDAFWVDVYFDPDVMPALNRPWDTIASHGLVWGITSTIPAGEHLTLTIDDEYYFSEYSSVPPLPVNVEVYGLVDSINYDTDYGTVRERDETNNLFGPVISTTGLEGLLQQSGDDNRASMAESLPDRQSEP